MTASRLLAHCKAHDIRLTVAGDKLRFDAPTEAVNDALRQSLRDHKAEILALLATAPGALEARQSDFEPEGGSNPYPLPETRPEASQAVPDQTSAGAVDVAIDGAGADGDTTPLTAAEKIQGWEAMFGWDPGERLSHWRDPVDNAARRGRRRNVF
jgi:hypothetical protein